jgi:hypothetical protein
VNDKLPCEGNTCTCGQGYRFAKDRGKGLLAGECEACGGTYIEQMLFDPVRTSRHPLTEQDVRRIVREELVDLSRRALNRVARGVLPSGG